MSANCFKLELRQPESFIYSCNPVPAILMYAICYTSALPADTYPLQGQTFKNGVYQLLAQIKLSWEELYIRANLRLQCKSYLW